MFLPSITHIFKEVSLCNKILRFLIQHMHTCTHLLVYVYVGVSLTFATDMTDVWILPCVYVRVELHPLLADKAQSTEFTLVGPLPRVETPVTLHGSHLCRGSLFIKNLSNRSV